MWGFDPADLHLSDMPLVETSPVFLGLPVAPQWKATGVTGANTTPLTLSGANASGAPTAGAHVKGEIAGDDTGKLWYCTVAGTPGTWVNIAGSSPVSDAAYGSGWNGDTTTAPSKNAVYDKIETLGSGTVSDAAYGSGWNGDTTVAPSKNAVYDKIETLTGGGTPFKYIKRTQAGNYSLTSTSFVAVDATNIGYLTLDLAVGQVVRCFFQAQGFMDGAQSIGWDFQVDRPTSADTTVSNGNEWGIVALAASSSRVIWHYQGLFVATEAGVHGFRPSYRVTGGVLTLSNATSGGSEADIYFSVERLGTPAA